jgi:hypothetical protein
MDPQTNLYLRYYSAQAGGQLPTFNGARRGQYGAGLGDILKSIWRTIFPIAARGASTFLSETLRAKDSGSDWGAAARSAIAPLARNVGASVIEKIASAATSSASVPTTQSQAVPMLATSPPIPNAGQTGSGRCQRQKGYNLRDSIDSQCGSGSHHRGYKRRKSSGKKHSEVKRIKFLNF